MTNWSTVQNTGAKKGGYVKGDPTTNLKYLTLKTPQLGVDATFYVRFVGDLHVFYSHWISAKNRKFCLKTLTMRYPNGDYVYKKQDPQGNLTPYTMEDIGRCPLCARGEQPKIRYASNVIDLAELDRTKEFNVRLMEFPTTVKEYMEYFINNFKIYPNDQINAPAFIISLKYPKKSGITNQDVRYEVDWSDPGKSPLSDSDMAIISQKMHNLVTEYDPFRPGVQCQFGDASGATNVSAPTVASGFGAPITGATPSQFSMPQAPVQPQQASAPQYQPQPAVFSPAQLDPIVQPTAPVQPTAGVPSFSFGPIGPVQPVPAQPIAPVQPIAPTIPGAIGMPFPGVPGMPVPTPVDTPAPAESNSLLSDIDNVFKTLQP